METEAVRAQAPRRRRNASPFLRGMTILPFGLVLGFTATALPFLLTHKGMSLGSVAGVSATIVSPTVYAFLLKPLLDTGFSRKIYSWVLIVIGAVAFAFGMSVLGPDHLKLAVPSLLIASLSLVLYSGATNGWISTITEDHERGTVAGWTNVANLGAASLGAYAVMTLLQRNLLTQREVALGLGLVAILGATPLLLLPDPPPPAFKFRQVVTETPKAIWRAVKTKRCLVGFALLLLPAAGTAAQNLQSGLGEDFHTKPETVIWLMGIAVAIIASLGAYLGGKIADKLPRMYVYLFAGLGTATTALVTAFLPHTPPVFIVSTLIYNFFVGVIYSAYNSLGYELTGTSPVASTQLGMFAASINANLTYMTYIDGRGYHWGGVRGLYLVDGLASLVFILPLLLLVRHLRKQPAALQDAAAV